MIKWLLSLVLLVSHSLSWSIPGLIPKNYEKGQILDIFVSRLESPQTAFNYDYYILPWCRPKLDKRPEGPLPDIPAPEPPTTLTGAPLKLSPYSYTVGVNKNVTVCEQTM
jgi:hypothetical protein